MSFATFCEILNSAVVTMHGWLKVTALGTVHHCANSLVGWIRVYEYGEKRFSPYSYTFSYTQISPLLGLNCLT